MAAGAERALSVVSNPRIAVGVTSAPGSRTPSASGPRETGVCQRVNRRNRAGFVFLYSVSFLCQVRVMLPHSNRNLGTEYQAPMSVAAVFIQITRA